MTPQLSHGLLEQAHQMLDDPRLAAVIRAHCPGLPDSVDAASLELRIHPDCQMLAHSLKAHSHAPQAVSQYYAVALQQYHVVREIMHRLGFDESATDFLDFACGYGRLLRFLAPAFPGERLWASEIQPDALDFVARTFGVRTLPSAERPDAFEPGRRFDLVWVASLFSHLPESLFGPWLARLTGLLTDDGVLCFSVHDEALLPDDMAVPESGLLYIEGSENADLDPGIYGTTFVTEDFVQTRIDEALGRGTPRFRLPKLLAHEQDIYVVAASPDRAPASLADFRRGARGWLDDHYLDTDGRLFLRGWAASLDTEPLDHVAVRLNGREERLVPAEPRSRVAEVLREPRLSHCGFSCRLELPAKADSAWLTLSAVPADGPPALIYTGPPRTARPA